MRQTIFCWSWRIEGALLVEASTRAFCGKSMSNNDRNWEASLQRPCFSSRVMRMLRRSKWSFVRRILPWSSRWPLAYRILNETYPFWSRWVLRFQEGVQAACAKPPPSRDRRWRDALQFLTTPAMLWLRQTIVYRPWRIEGALLVEASMQALCGKSKWNKDRNWEESLQRPCFSSGVMHMRYTSGPTTRGGIISEVTLGMLVVGFWQLNGNVRSIHFSLPERQYGKHSLFAFDSCMGQCVKH